MSDYKYIIVGGGMTADSAMNGIGEVDESGKIAVFSSEADAPYNRPPLSKGLWKGDPLDSIWRKGDEESRDIFLSTRVLSVNAEEKAVKSSDGKTFRYEKLLLATGGTPRKLPFGGDGVIYFRTVADYRKLKKLCQVKNDFVVIGGGFIGSEIAAALAMNGKHVTMIFPEDGIGSRAYPGGLSGFLNSYYAGKGVKVISGGTVDGIESVGEHYKLRTGNGELISTDGIVAGLGIIPNDEIAKSVNLAVGNGIVVDEFLRTDNHDIFAAGDVANFYSKPLDLRMRVEHEDNANMMGLISGHNMAGRSESYDHLPFFYTDMFDLGYEAVGLIDSRLETVEEWEEKYRKGVVYYLETGKLRGVLLWNTWGKVDVARELIKSRRSFSRNELTGLIKD